MALTDDELIDKWVGLLDTKGKKQFTFQYDFSEYRPKDKQAEQAKAKQLLEKEGLIEFVKTDNPYSYQTTDKFAAVVAAGGWTKHKIAQADKATADAARQNLQDTKAKNDAEKSAWDNNKKPIVFGLLILGGVCVAIGAIISILKYCTD